ncbi:hypothetical protein NHX12_002866, partial [Muraenolepis orangiensis]
MRSKHEELFPGGEPEVGSVVRGLCGDGGAAVPGVRPGLRGGPGSEPGSSTGRPIRGPRHHDHPRPDLKGPRCCPGGGQRSSYPPVDPPPHAQGESGTGPGG